MLALTSISWVYRAERASLTAGSKGSMAGDTSRAMTWRLDLACFFLFFLGFFSSCLSEADRRLGERFLLFAPEGRRDGGGGGARRKREEKKKMASGREIEEEEEEEEQGERPTNRPALRLHACSEALLLLLLMLLLSRVKEREKKGDESAHAVAEERERDSSLVRQR